MGSLLNIIRFRRCNQICSYLASSQSNLFILACPQADLFISGLLTIKSVHIGMHTSRSIHIWPSHNQICSYWHAHKQICSYLASSQSNLFIWDKKPPRGAEATKARRE